VECARLQDGHDDHDPQDVGRRRDDERQGHPEGDVHVGVLNLFSDAGDLREPGVRHEDQAHGREQPGHPERHERRELVLPDLTDPDRRDLQKALDEEEEEDREQDHDQPPLKASRLLSAHDVHDGEQHRQGDGELLDRDIEEQAQIRAHPDQREGALQDERDPRPDPAHRPHDRAQRAVEEVVRAARPRHGGRELGHAQHRRQHEDARDQVGENDGGPGLGGRESRQQEEARAEHGAGADGEHVE
jgi:hypothetical protein